MSVNRWIVMDVEADGPAPGPDLYSMVSFGAVVVEPALSRTFFGQTGPISEKFKPDALNAIGVTRQEHEMYPDPLVTMEDFVKWLDDLSAPGDRLTFVSDNPAFDWQFINGYLWRYCESNPMGYSGRRIGDLYSGWKGDARLASAWKSMRKTKHTHHPVDDAMGNAEALLEMQRLGLILPF